MIIYHRLLTQSSFILLTILFIALLTSCATTNYYTAKTLDTGEKAVSAGADNLILVYRSNRGKLLSTIGFTPSFGYVQGLPIRLETGVKIFWPYAIEGILRHQINKDTFKYFDVSANLHYGAYYHITGSEIDIISRNTKYGLTVSKEVNELQPFISYYRYNPKISLPSTNNTITSVVTIGLGFPFRDSYLFPEINYLIKNDNINDGMLFFGMGVRSTFNNE